MALVDAQLVAAMRRTVTTDHVRFDLLAHRTLARREIEVLDQAARRYGEYLRMSGAIATEYAPQVAAPRTASRSPQRFAETLFPEPAVTSTTPANDIDAAIQKRRLSVSIPTSLEMSAVKIGSVPNRRAAVVAVVRSSA